MTDALTVVELADTAAMVARFRSRGFTPSGAASKAELVARCATALLEAGASPGTGVEAWVVPGRIEVLGKHTDYAGGRSLVAATEQGFCLAGARRRDAVLRVFDAAAGRQAALTIGPDLPAAPGDWSDYARTVARRLARNFPGPLAGMDLALCSDLPIAAGMSSSSAMVTGVFLALAGRNGLAGHPAYRAAIDSPEAMASYVASIENGSALGSLVGDRGVGTFGGSEDHTAILCCRPGRISRYAYSPVRSEGTIAMPAGCVFVVAASGVQANKTGAARDRYNRLSQLARTAVEAWNLRTGRHDPHLAAAMDAMDGDTGQIGRVLQTGRHNGFDGNELDLRLRHFAAESCEVVPAAADALAAGDLDAFGRLADRSQALAESALGNQIAETSLLARAARQLGARAASAFGAGFGGAVWALVTESEAEDFRSRWRQRYHEEVGDHLPSEFLITPASGAACPLAGPGDN